VIDISAHCLFQPEHGCKPSNIIAPLEGRAHVTDQILPLAIILATEDGELGEQISRVQPLGVSLPNLQGHNGGHGKTADQRFGVGMRNQRRGGDERFAPRRVIIEVAADYPGAHSGAISC